MEEYLARAAAHELPFMLLSSDSVLTILFRSIQVEREKRGRERERERESKTRERGRERERESKTREREGLNTREWS